MLAAMVCAHLRGCRGHSDQPMYCHLSSGCTHTVLPSVQQLDPHRVAASGQAGHARACRPQPARCTVQHKRCCLPAWCLCSDLCRTGFHAQYLSPQFSVSSNQFSTLTTTSSNQFSTFTTTSSNQLELQPGKLMNC